MRASPCSLYLGSASFWLSMDFRAERSGFKYPLNPLSSYMSRGCCIISLLDLNIVIWKMGLIIVPASRLPGGINEMQHVSPLTKCFVPGSSQSTFIVKRQALIVASIDQRGKNQEKCFRTRVGLSGQVRPLRKNSFLKQ